MQSVFSGKWCWIVTRKLFQLSLNVCLQTDAEAPKTNKILTPLSRQSNAVDIKRNGFVKRGQSCLTLLACVLYCGMCTPSKSQIALTTDSYVVPPIFFPGGDIGKLAVTGTLNDLAMCGARPCYLSCSFIIEEGFPIEDLKRIVQSMSTEARDQSIHIVKDMKN